MRSFVRCIPAVILLVVGATVEEAFAPIGAAGIKPPILFAVASYYALFHKWPATIAACTFAALLHGGLSSRVPAASSLVAMALLLLFAKRVARKQLEQSPIAAAIVCVPASAASALCDAAFTFLSPTPSMNATLLDEPFGYLVMLPAVALITGFIVAAIAVKLDKWASNTESHDKEFEWS